MSNTNLLNIRNLNLLNLNEFTPYFLSFAVLSLGCIMFMCFMGFCFMKSVDFHSQRIGPCLFIYRNHVGSYMNVDFGKFAHDFSKLSGNKIISKITNMQFSEPCSAVLYFDDPKVCLQSFSCVFRVELHLTFW